MFRIIEAHRLKGKTYSSVNKLFLCSIVLENFDPTSEMSLVPKVVRQKMYEQKLYYQGKVEVHHIDHDVESPEDDKCAITAMTSTRNHEANCIFQIDLESFLGALADEERLTFTMRIEGFNRTEIAEALGWNVSAVTKTLLHVGRKFADLFEIEFGIA
jgi:DNA-directed RNA polymerase specialized sigma24 family protein